MTAFSLLLDEVGVQVYWLRMCARACVWVHCPCVFQQWMTDEHGGVKRAGDSSLFPPGVAEQQGAFVQGHGLSVTLLVQGRTWRLFRVSHPAFWAWQVMVMAP